MEIRSRFLNADVEVHGVSRDGTRLVVEGLVKGLMPVRIAVDAGDVARILIRSFRLSTLSFGSRLPLALLEEARSALLGRVRPHPGAPCT